VGDQRCPVVKSPRVEGPTHSHVQVCTVGKDYPGLLFRCGVTGSTDLVANRSVEEKNSRTQEPKNSRTPEWICCGYAAFLV
jgi:hypothetical protein